MAKEIYVGHISENATEEDVWKLFSVMGTVTSVHLIIDPETGEFKRCGYVRMQSGVNLEEVVETLDGTYLVDREIVVSIARPQKPGMSKSGGNKQPWMKSGSRPGSKPGTTSVTRSAAKTGTKPAARPDTRADSAAEKRPSAGKGARPSSKPAASRSDGRAPQGKAPRTGSIPPRPRKSR